jgi:hypothetical protein
VRRPTYLARGIYHHAVARWQRIFSTESLHVIQSEAMFADPAKAVADTLDFLGLPPIGAIDLSPQNVGDYDGSDAEERKFLKEFYRPHNLKLARLTGKSLTW